MTHDPTTRLRQAAEAARQEATELARTPAPNLAGEYPDVDAAADHIKAMREMKIRYALAEVLDERAWIAENDPGAGGTTTDTAALAVADAILGTPG